MTSISSKSCVLMVHLSTCIKTSPLKIFTHQTYFFFYIMNCAFSVRSINTVRLALLAKERKKMYEFIQRGLSVLYTLTNWAKEMQQWEEKITKNLYTQCKAYL